MKYSVILSNVGSCCDRYMPGGYAAPFTTEQLFERVASIAGVTGVELIGGQIVPGNVAQIQELLHKHNLQAVSIIPDHFGVMKWGRGAFTSPDAGIRAQAVEETLAMADCAAKIGCDTISIWNGQDGFDYPFQADYERAWEWLADGVRACAKARPDIRFSLEYKPKEPRNHSFVSNMHATLLLIADIGEPNVGVTIDTGHAAVAYENLASAAVEALRRGKMFHFHYNDNYGLWDDDMIAGSVHTIEFIELLWWLRRMGYDGWLSVDQYPYREDGLAAVTESVRWMQGFEAAAAKLDDAAVRDALANNDAVKTTRLLRELLLGK